MKLDNPLLVRWEYASEERLAKRNSIFRALIEGDNPEDVAFDAVAEARPKRLLDVEVVEPFRATTRHAIFVAEKPR